ncbi:MAG: hypothetical protein HN930_05140 [Pelagibacterales bacterium]|nr:hypothetical protein [Pelagibacterales bacterium]
MNKSENKGLLATALLLLGLFFLGYYGRDSSSEISNNISVVEDDQLEIHKGL